MTYSKKVDWLDLSLHNPPAFNSLESKG